MNTQPNLWHPNNTQPIWQISDGLSSWGVSVVENTLDRIKWVLDSSEQIQVMNSQNRLNELIWDLDKESSRIRWELDYHYEAVDYYKKLSYSDRLSLDRYTQLSYILKELEYICKKLPLWDLILDSIEKIYLKDLLYESIDTSDIKFNTMTWMRLDIHGIDDIDKRINYINDKHLNRLILWHNTLSFILGLPNNQLLSYVKDCQALWVTKIDFDEVYFDILFRDSSEKFIEFIWFIWEYWIKSLDIANTWLDQLFKDSLDLFIEFIKVAWESWIRHLNLYSNWLQDIFWTNSELFIEFIKVAWNSWIRNINFSQNNFDDIFINDPESFIKFIKVAWNSWIKYIDLSLNLIYKIFKYNTPLFIEFIKVAWESWIKYLDLCNNGLLQLFWDNLDSFKLFLNTCRTSWLSGINITSNEFEKHFRNNIYNLSQIIKELEQI